MNGNMKSTFKLVLLITSLWFSDIVTAQAQPATITAMPDEAQAIAKEAFIYAYPMLFNYKTLYQAVPQCSVEPGSS